MNVGDVVEYKLPRLIDAEGNDEPEVIVMPTTDKEFPPFLHFDDFTN